MSGHGTICMNEHWRDSTACVHTIQYIQYIIFIASALVDGILLFRLWVGCFFKTVEGEGMNSIDYVRKDHARASKGRHQFFYFSLSLSLSLSLSPRA